MEYVKYRVLELKLAVRLLPLNERHEETICKVYLYRYFDTLWYSLILMLCCVLFSHTSDARHRIDFRWFWCLIQTDRLTTYIRREQEKKAAIFNLFFFFFFSTFSLIIIPFSLFSFLLVVTLSSLVLHPSAHGRSNKWTITGYILKN